MEWRRVRIPKRGSGGSMRQCDFSKVRGRETGLFIFFSFSDRNWSSIVLHCRNVFHGFLQKNIAFESRDTPIRS